MSMHTVGETAEPVASMASDFESSAARTDQDSLPEVTRAPVSDQPPAPELEAGVGHEAVVVGVAEGLEGLGRRRRLARRLCGGGNDEDGSDAQQGRQPGAQPSRSKYIRQIRDPLVHVDPRSARVRLIGRQLSRVLETTVADMSRFGLLVASR